MFHGFTGARTADMETHRYKLVQFKYKIKFLGTDTSQELAPMMLKYKFQKYTIRIIGSRPIQISHITCFYYQKCESPCQWPIPPTGLYRDGAHNIKVPWLHSKHSGQEPRQAGGPLTSLSRLVAKKGYMGRKKVIISLSKIYTFLGLLTLKI